jgi:hypothetical protein
MEWLAPNWPGFGSGSATSVLRRYCVRALATIATVVGVLARPAAGQGRVAYARGVEALSRHDIGAAMREFGRAAADSNRALHSAGEQWLGHLSWMIFADAHEATLRLNRALADATDSASVLIERARLEGFERRFRDGTRTAVYALRLALDDEHRGLAARTTIDIAVEGAFVAYVNGTPIADSIDDAMVRVAGDTLRVRVDRFPGRTSDAYDLMNAEILLHDDQAVIAGWKSYYTLADQPTTASLDPARRLIEAGSLAGGLAASRLYELAALVGATTRQSAAARRDTALSDIAAYVRFLHRLRLSVDEVYRRELIGKTNPGDLERVLNTQTRALWPTLHWPSNRAPPRYFPAAVPAELARRFGTILSVGRRAPIPELTLAHAVTSFKPNVAGAPARERLMVLDGVVINGVDEWLLDGSGGRAGWASGDSIFEVRTALTETPYRSWVALTDPQGIPGEMLRLQRDSVSDIARARTDSAAYLPGVAARIFRSGATRIFDSLSAATPSYVECERAFVRIVFEQLTRTTITLHETRHVLDSHRGNEPSGADAEFRAKIDEVAMAPRPKLALTAILHPNIGDSTPHGQANRRIMLGLIRWLRANSAAIAGFDNSLPALVQLPLLSDAQLRAAFRSLRGST